MDFAGAVGHEVGGAGARLSFQDLERAGELGRRQLVPGDEAGGLFELARAPFDVGGHHRRGVARGLVERVAHRRLERVLVACDQRKAGGGERDRRCRQEQQGDLVQKAHRLSRLCGRPNAGR
jgi:hypothetical protein